MSHSSSLPNISDPHHATDPFGEFRPGGLKRELTLLGARFEFRSHSAELLDLVDAAYAGLPAHHLDLLQAPLRVELTLLEGNAPTEAGEPPEPQMRGGAGLFGAVIDAANFAFVSPESRSATVGISRGLLAHHRYHARYELLEFAVFMLASRAQRLVALHGACVGWQGRGALLIGESGAGKTTLAMQSLLDGLEFLTEDASFVDPASLRATGVANFLHPRFDALRFVRKPEQRALIEASPTIRRRSGVAKYEVDLRQSGGTLAAAPLALHALVLLSALAADEGPLLRPLRREDAFARLRASQPYAAQHENWTSFEASLAQHPCFELRRGSHPAEAVAALRELLGAHGPAHAAQADA
jgi:hypothetical protein